MLKIGIAVVVIGYFMITMTIGPSIVMTKMILREEKAPNLVVKTMDMLLVIMLMYLIPIIGIMICTVCYEQAIAFIMLAIVLSFFPVSQYAIKHIKIAKKEFYPKS